MLTKQQLKEIVKQAIQEELMFIAHNMVPETMTQDHVAEKLGLEPSTLAVWRSTGKGPKFIKSGSRVMYLASDVADYIRQNRICP